MFPSNKTLTRDQRNDSTGVLGILTLLELLSNLDDWLPPTALITQRQKTLSPMGNNSQTCVPEAPLKVSSLKQLFAVCIAVEAELVDLVAF